MSDLLQNLPTDNSPNNPDDLQLINNLFNTHSTKPSNQQGEEYVEQIAITSNRETLLCKLKSSLIASILFLALSLPVIDQMIHKLTNNKITVLCSKFILFFVSFLLLKSYLI